MSEFLQKADCSDKVLYIVLWDRDKAPRKKRCGGHLARKRVLSYEDTQWIVHYVINFTNIHAVPLPGRIPGFKKSDILMLPTFETKVLCVALVQKRSCVIMVSVFLNLYTYICTKRSSAQASDKDSNQSPHESDPKRLSDLTLWWRTGVVRFSLTFLILVVA
jgi:hypothetical protein